MQLASSPTFPRPAALPKLAVDIDLARDAVELDGTGNRRLPKELEYGVHLPIRTTALDYEGEPIVDWYAAGSQYDSALRMRREGFASALAGAQLVAKQHEAVAVVQAAKSGIRYLVPLGVWDPADESQLSFEDVGGTPYWKRRTDHMLMRNDSDADVEAVVFDGGASWLNFTGHPVRLPQG